MSRSSMGPLEPGAPRTSRRLKISVRPPAILIGAIVSSHSERPRAKEITVAQLRQVCHEMISATEVDHGMVPTANGFRAEFEGPADAVRCGLFIRHRLARHHAPSQLIRLRISIHFGDAIEAAASRLAYDDALYISRGVYEAVKDDLVTIYSTVLRKDRNADIVVS